MPSKMFAFCACFAALLTGSVVKKLIAALFLFASIASNGTAMFALEDDTTTLTAAVRCFTWTRHE